MFKCLLFCASEVCVLLAAKHTGACVSCLPCLGIWFDLRAAFYGGVLFVSVQRWAAENLKVQRPKGR